MSAFRGLFAEGKRSLRYTQIYRPTHKDYLKIELKHNINIAKKQ